jgi:hypothetical protein
MSVESLMHTCAELGIRLALKGDDNDRLQVDAPKGALTASIREGLTAHKADVISLLKTKQLESLKLRLRRQTATKQKSDRLDRLERLLVLHLIRRLHP